MLVFEQNKEIKGWKMEFLNFAVAIKISVYVYKLDNTFFSYSCKEKILRSSLSCLVGGFQIENFFIQSDKQAKIHIWVLVIEILGIAWRWYKGIFSNYLRLFYTFSGYRAHVINSHFPDTQHTVLGVQRPLSKRRL